MLFDDVAAALPGLRAETERGMVDAVTIERRRLDANGEPVRTMDPDTLAYTDVWDPVHSGKCRIQRFRGQGMADMVVGGAEFGKTALMVQLPIGVPRIDRGDRVTVTAVDPISTAVLVGAVATVSDDLTKTHATKRTLMCEEVSP